MVAVRRQIGELAQLVGQVVADLGVARARDARAWGMSFDYFSPVAGNAAEEFRTRALAAQRLGVSPLFKSPLVPEVMSEVRATLDLLGSAPSRNHEGLLGPPWCFMGVDAQPPLLAAYNADAALVIQTALLEVWYASVKVPRDLKQAVDRGLSARARWLKSRG